MSPDGIRERADRIVAARRLGVADRDQVAAALRDAEQAKAWFDAQIAGLISTLGQLESMPERTIADTSRCSLGAATKTKERSDTLADTPTLADALADGAVTAGHVDAVTRGKKKLDDAEQQAEFIERVESLVDVAAAGTIEAFGRRLDLEIRKIRSDDGEERLTRQKKQTRLSHWVDNDGMWNVRGRFDPVTGLDLAGRIDHAVRALFAAEVPEHCPADAVEKNKFLNAHALIALLGSVPSGTSATAAAPDAGAEGGGVAAPGVGGTIEPIAGRRRIEAVVVIDVDANPGAGPEITFPIPIEIPHRVLADLVDDADVHPIVVRNGVVLHAPGALDLGRTTRLANRAQRRALRALYRCCAVPGCTVAYDRCKIHHVIWWRHGGRTDLDNLLPVCSKHHTRIHQDEWTISLGPNRELTIRLPDGRTMSSGPPDRRAA